MSPWPRCAVVALSSLLLLSCTPDGDADEKDTEARGRDSGGSTTVPMPARLDLNCPANGLRSDGGGLAAYGWDCVQAIPPAGMAEGRPRATAAFESNFSFQASVDAWPGTQLLTSTLGGVVASYSTGGGDSYGAATGVCLYDDYDAAMSVSGGRLVHSVPPGGCFGNGDTDGYAGIPVEAESLVVWLTDEIQFTDGQQPVPTSEFYVVTSSRYVPDSHSTHPHMAPLESGVAVLAGDLETDDRVLCWHRWASGAPDGLECTDMAPPKPVQESLRSTSAWVVAASSAGDGVEPVLLQYWDVSSGVPGTRASFTTRHAGGVDFAILGDRLFVMTLNSLEIWNLGSGAEATFEAELGLQGWRVGDAECGVGGALAASEDILYFLAGSCDVNGVLVRDTVLAFEVDHVLAGDVF